MCEANTVGLEEVDYKVTKALDITDDLEQHVRANSVRVYGIKDTGSSEDEKTTIGLLVSLFQDKLDSNVTEDDINVAHRLGPYTPGTDRGIICKFLRRVDRHDIIRARRILAGTGISINDDLTTNRRVLLNTMSRKDHVAQVWTSKGNVFAKHNNGNVSKVESPAKTAISNYEKKHKIVTVMPKFLRKDRPENSGSGRRRSGRRRDTGQGRNSRHSDQ